MIPRAWTRIPVLHFLILRTFLSVCMAAWLPACRPPTVSCIVNLNVYRAFEFSGASSRSQTVRKAAGSSRPGILTEKPSTGNPKTPLAADPGHPSMMPSKATGSYA